MPDDHHAVRRSITSRISKILSDFGLENAVSGGKFDPLRQPISTDTGLWGRSAASKPSRMIVHFRMSDGTVEAAMPPHPGQGTFAYANTGNRAVAVLSIRVLPVIQVSEGEFLPYEEWEWLLWYCFWPTLERKTSGKTFNSFDPENGTFRYAENEQPYVAAGLVTLNESQSVFEAQQHNIRFTYDEATEALRQLIRVSPKSPVASGQQEEQGDA